MTGGANVGDAPAIAVTGLSMAYGRHRILDGVSLQVRRGETVALLGPNGAGKTTTIEVLEGLRRPSAGEVRVLGVDPWHGDEPWRARVGVVLQAWHDHPKWRVRELLAHVQRLHAPLARRGVWAVDELLAATGIADCARQRVSTLSGGQRRRLDIALGVVARPEVLFMDEPTAGFDPEGRRAFQRLIADVVDRDTAAFVTTHDLEEAERIADRIVILAAGRIVAAGTVDELAAQTGAGAEVTWTLDGRPHRRRTQDPTGLVRTLMAEYDDRVGDLRVQRRSLEDIYLAIVQHAETGDASTEPVLVGGGAA